jgi:hypothetical protein
VYSRLLKAYGFLLVGMLLTAPAAGQQPTFPLLQDGGARSAFVGGIYRTCLKEQRAASENASLSTPELGAFCLCFGRAIADVINGAEYEALTAGKPPGSFVEKQHLAANVCISRMSTSQQTSQASQQKVAVENKCLQEYHPEDTDYSAAQVRGRFCGCYAVAVTASGRDAKSPRIAMDYCSQRQGPND